MSACLCIFARTPELGRVKQRLARAVGEEAALAAHEELLRRMLQQAAVSERYRTELWLTSVSGPLPDWLEKYRRFFTLSPTSSSTSRCTVSSMDSPES